MIKLAADMRLLKWAESINIFVVNKCGMYVTHTDSLSEKYKNMDVKFHLIKDKVKDGTMYMTYDTTE